MKRLLILALMMVPVATSAAASELQHEVVATVVFDDDELDSVDPASQMALSLRLRDRNLGAGFSAEAFLSLGGEFDLKGSGEVGHRAPFLRIGWRPASWAEREGLFLTAYLLSSERLHLGWEYPATWGRAMGFNVVSSSAPAAELRLERERWYGFVAARSALALNGGTHEQERNWMGLAGAGLELFSMLRLEVAGGRLALGAVGTGGAVRAKTEALAGRVLYHRGDSIGPSVDYSFNRNDPELFETAFVPERYPGGLSASASLEAMHLSQTLADPVVYEPTEKVQDADVAAMRVRVKAGFLRAHLLGLYRSAIFPRSGETPEVFPHEYALLESAKPRGELLARGGVDYHFPSLHLTPGLVIGAGLPATVQHESMNADGTATTRTVVLVDQTLVLLPAGEERGLAVVAKATLRWDWKEALSAVGELSWSRDPNQSIDATTRTSEAKESVGFAAVLQARF